MFGKSKRSAEEQRRDMIINYQRTFQSEHGKKVLHDLMKSSLMITTTFDDDPYRTAFNEGQRALVMRILLTINVDPNQMEELLKMGQSEAHND